MHLDLVTLEVDPVENGLYQWTGPNNFTATERGGFGRVNLQDSGTYVVQGFTGECEIENDTIEVVMHSPLPAPVLSEISRRAKESLQPWVQTWKRSHGRDPTGSRQRDNTWSFPTSPQQMQVCMWPP